MMASSTETPDDKTKSAAARGEELARRMLRLQEDRAAAYAKLRSAHKDYLSSSSSSSSGGEGGGEYDFDTYKLAVGEATERFKSASEEAIEVKKQCEGGDDKLSDLSDLVGRLQGLEEQQLRLTVDLQLARQEEKENPGDDLHERNVRGLRKRLDEVATEVVEATRELRYFLPEDEEEDDDDGQQR